MSTPPSRSSTSKSCGLKNSLCPGISSNEAEGSENALEQRFSFVDGRSGLWTIGQDYSDITCPVGGLVVFNYPVGTHDVVALESKDDWENCRGFDNASLLSPRTILPAPSSSGSYQFDDITYYYNCSIPGSTAYVTCSVPGHCQAKQKVAIHTSDTEYTYDGETGNWTLHVDSLSRVLRLLGYRVNGRTSEAVVVMDLGYQTEELADATTKLIWCALDHCPHFSREVDPAATLADCESTVYTLLGFVSRKRPVPQWIVSEDYYRRAIDRGGKNLCTAQSYLTQLYLSKGDWGNATVAIEKLCLQCKDEGALIRQAQSEYSRLGLTADALDFQQICDSAGKVEETNVIAGNDTSHAPSPYHGTSLALLWLTTMVAFLLRRQAHR